MMSWALNISWHDVLVLALQSGLLLVVGLALPRWLKLSNPAWAARYWQGLLVLCLLLPLGAFWPPQLPVLTAELNVLAETWSATETLSPATNGLPWPSLLWIWAIGTALRFGWLALGMVALQRWRHDATPWTGDPAVDAARRDLATRRVLQTPFLVSERVTAPVTFGLWRPVVLLPKDFAQLDDDGRRAVALHELTHVERGDVRRQLAEECLHALLWFHPAPWLLLPRIRLCREQQVDRHVLRRCARRPYLKSLLHYAGGPSWSPAPASCFFQPGHLHKRLAAMTQEVPMNRSKLLLTTGVLCALLSLTALAGWTVFPWSAAHAGDGSEKVIHHVEGDVQAPKRTHGPAPSYPEGIAKEDRIAGVVVVKAIIDEHGNVAEMDLVESLEDAYDQAAMDAIAQWRFEPATLDGKPVSVYYVLTINFRLA